jgi:hypothetical protein
MTTPLPGVPPVNKLAFVVEKQWRPATGLAVPMPTLPDVVMAAKVAVPDNAGLAERTTDPVPVEVVTPDPPRATASVPDPAFPMLRAVIPDPAPVRVVALTVAAFIVPVKTSRAVCGFVVPTPTFPFAPTKRAVDPVVVRKVATFPVPSCWTLKAFPDAVLPNTKQLLVFRTTGMVGAP